MDEDEKPFGLKEGINVQLNPALDAGKTMTTVKLLSEVDFEIIQSTWLDQGDKDKAMGDLSQLCRLYGVELPEGESLAFCLPWADKIWIELAD